jgi:hypothetical protein
VSDVVLLRAVVRPGLPERVFDALAAVRRRLDPDGPVERALRSWVEPVLDAEGMYTESLFLDRSGERYEVFWYMEAAEFERVNEAYAASEHPLTDGSERALGFLFEDAGRLFDATEDGGDFDLLVHAWHPDRP